jgi:hypothetical protein
MVGSVPVRQGKKRRQAPLSRRRLGLSTRGNGTGRWSESLPDRAAPRALPACVLVQPLRKRNRWEGRRGCQGEAIDERADEVGVELGGPLLRMDCGSLVQVFYGLGVARVGRIDRRIREIPSPLDALLYACHLRLMNGYRSSPWLNRKLHIGRKNAISCEARGSHGGRKLVAHAPGGDARTWDRRCGFARRIRAARLQA